MQSTQPLDDDRVMELVKLVLLQPREARDAYLKEVCAGDAVLFAAVSKYVEAEVRTNSVLPKPLYPRLHDHEFQPGELLAGRFRIVREVGQGGMGVVYEAKDERLESRIALKCARRRFRKRLPPEVRNAREISHPNVCRIFEIHTTITSDCDVDFLTMEFLEGETLAARLRRGPLPKADALAIARQICSGVAEAHRNGVVHGDLKSSNVILAEDANGGVRAVVTDFGLARKRTGRAEGVAEVAPAGNSGESRTGGTPGYMAPELCGGEKPSVASDVYALGVMLYEIAANHRPYPDGRQNGVNQKPPALHHNWDPVLRRCLEPDPVKRFRDGGEVAAAIEPGRGLRWWMEGAAAVALAAIFGLAIWWATLPKESRRLAMLPIESSSAWTSPLANDLSGDVAGQLGRLNGGRVARSGFVRATPNAATERQATHRLRATLTKENDRLLLHALLTDARSRVKVRHWAADYAPEQVRPYAPFALADVVTSTLNLP
jgi:hypothetical protein